MQGKHGWEGGKEERGQATGEAGVGQRAGEGGREGGKAEHCGLFIDHIGQKA